MGSAWKKRRVGFLAALLATLIFATPLLCALHSLHAAQTVATSSAEMTFVQATGEGSSHHRHDAEELCQAGAGLTAPHDGLKVRPACVSLRRAETWCASRTPEVPKPVPIPFPTFRA